MNRDEKQRGGSVLGLIVIAVIAAINILGFAGLTLVIPIIIIIAVFRAVSKARVQGADDESAVPRAGRSANERYPLSGRSVAENMRDDSRRHREELDDLLKAGIIDQAEYHDRMIQLKREDF